MTTTTPFDDDLTDEFDDDLLEDEVPEAPSAFALELRPALEKILEALVKAELIEFEAEKRELLFQDMTEAAENARHPKEKAILKKVLYALINSENVEEVFGSDPELMQIIKKAVSS